MQERIGGQKGAFSTSALVDANNFRLENDLWWDLSASSPLNSSRSVAKNEGKNGMAVKERGKRKKGKGKRD